MSSSPVYIKVIRNLLLLQVSVGTLLAFTMVAVSLLILRYIPPDEVPIPPSLEESNNLVPSKYRLISDHIYVKNAEANSGASEHNKPVVIKEDMSIHYPLISKNFAISNCESCLSFSSIPVLYRYKLCSFS